MQLIATKEELKKVCFRLSIRQIDSVSSVAINEGSNWTSTMRELVDFALNNHSVSNVNNLIKTKQEELKKINLELESKKSAHSFFERLNAGNTNNGDAICQRCGTTKSKRKMFKVRIGVEELKFCDDCYFSGDYKLLVRQLI